jgi:hypothetical protein
MQPKVPVKACKVIDLPLYNICIVMYFCYFILLLCIVEEEQSLSNIAVLQLVTW